MTNPAIWRAIPAAHKGGQQHALQAAAAAAAARRRSLRSRLLSVLSSRPVSLAALLAGTLGAYVTAAFLLVYAEQTLAAILLGLVALLGLVVIGALAASPVISYLNYTAMTSEEFWDRWGAQTYRQLRGQGFAPDEIAHAYDLFVYRRRSTRDLVVGASTSAAFLIGLFVGKDWIDDVVGKWMRAHVAAGFFLVVVGSVLVAALVLSPVWYAEHPAASIRRARDVLR